MRRQYKPVQRQVFNFTSHQHYYTHIMYILIHNTVRWPKQSENWIIWTKTWWTNFWVTINCPSDNAGKQKSLMVYFISFPTHISWKCLMVSWLNNSLWTVLCPQMLTVRAYAVIASKYRLVCDKHEEQEEKITRIWLQTSLTKLHSTRVIMWA